ncbi:MAG: 50S ribosomal protein L17 [Candidatus Portnoybacteria bacterium]|nr:50S ribosomal protein L17 [Candidatus Portnoybacteria bacterium]
MKKGKVGRKFHRERDQRKAFLKSLARNLVWSQRLRTTQARAKELRPFIEPLVTKAKKGNLANIRLLKKYFDDQTVFKLSKEIGPRYIERPGGYTRIIKLPPRRGDGAKMAIIEFV